MTWDEEGWGRGSSAAGAQNIGVRSPEVLIMGVFSSLLSLVFCTSLISLKMKQGKKITGLH